GTGSSCVTASASTATCGGRLPTRRALAPSSAGGLASRSTMGYALNGTGPPVESAPDEGRPESRVGRRGRAGDRLQPLLERNPGASLAPARGHRARSDPGLPLDTG